MHALTPGPAEGSTQGDTPGWLVHMALGASAQVDIGNNSNPIVRLTNCSYEPKVQVSPTSPRANQVVFTVNYYPIQLCNPCVTQRATTKCTD